MTTTKILTTMTQRSGCIEAVFEAVHTAHKKSSTPEKAAARKKVCSGACGSVPNPSAALRRPRRSPHIKLSLSFVRALLRFKDKRQICARWFIRMRNQARGFPYVFLMYTFSLWFLMFLQPTSQSSF